MRADPNLIVTLNREAGRLEIEQEGQVAFLTFRLRGSVLSLLHTETPAALQGRGLAAALVRHALLWARAHNCTVKPFCPFAAAYIRRHAEFHALVDPDFHGLWVNSRA